MHAKVRPSPAGVICVDDRRNGVARGSISRVDTRKHPPLPTSVALAALTVLLDLAAHRLADREDTAGHLEHTGELVGLLEQVADGERAVAAEHHEVVLLEPVRKQLGDLGRLPARRDDCPIRM